ncbi:hypothetical protein PpBr36_08277 [Pyricularia pennisetigena]|uniref:hypothetical protein n=1 Tax=Pyricularia pennisetigena TaxID=1578925 RepID=UPI00114DC01E|nr:hypothetical protein PpBr36_08277 [Pyricularia pennisetigena]TLS24589.1 hypothetical protein PpBr36_08277 [Pyricularia pennisetigena]
MSQLGSIRYVAATKKSPLATLLLKCHVKPGASKSREGVAAVTDDAVELCVSAQAREGEANKAVIMVLSKALGLAKSDLTITHGLKSRDKTVLINGKMAQGPEVDVISRAHELLRKASQIAFRPAAAMAAQATARRGFHTTRPAFVKVGDPLPDAECLVEGSPGNKVNIAKEFALNNGLIIGVPAAFSGACSTSHIPSYMKHPKIKDVGQVFVISVNDPFVMKAWAEQMDPAGDSGFRFLGDPQGVFTKTMDLDFDGKAIFGNDRSKRYALVIENGRVKSAHVEPDNTGTNVSMADKVLG